MLKWILKGSNPFKKNKGVRPLKKGIAVIAAAVLALAGVGGTLALNGFFGGGTVPEDTFTRGLAGYWSFDEGTGSKAYDASGNGNNGTLTGGAKWTAGKNGGALQFDGKDDWVDVGNGSSLNITDTITIEGWIKLANGVRSTIVGKGTGSIGIRTYLFSKEATNNLSFLWTDDNLLPASSVTSNVPLDDLWHYVTVTFDAGAVNLYIDGKNVGSGSGDTSIQSCTETFLGSSSWGGGRPTGLLDDVRIYNRALTAAEVKYHYNHGGPVGYWNFDEGSGTVARDSSGNNNDGTILGATWADGKYGGALSFDGLDNYASVPNSASLNPSSKITIGLWVKRTGAGTGITPGLLSKRDNGFGLLWQVGSDTEILSSRIYQSDGTQINSGNIAGVLSVGIWRYINLVADGENVITYVDGIPKKSVPYDGTIKTGTALLTIGQQSNQYFNGLIDDVKIYDYARTADEIRLDYQAGMAAHLGPRGKTCSEDPASCMDKGLAGHWDMDEGGGSVIDDKSGNGNHGTLTNGPKWTTGKNGGALQFDGKNDYVNCGSNSNLDIYETLSIEAWIRPDMAKNADIISRYYYSSPTDNGGYSLRFWNDGNFYFVTLNDLQGGISTNGLSGEWNHVIVTYDINGGENNLKIYLNGLLANQATRANALKSISRDFKIGTWGYYYDGAVDEARIYNRVLSAEEVRYHYNQGAPVGYWKFDEGSGTAAKDSSGNGNDGTISGATWTDGKYGSALSFDGASNYVDAGNGSALNITNAVTIESWVKLAAMPDSPYSTIISKGTSAATSYWMDIRSGGRILFGGYTAEGAPCYQDTGVKITTTNQWYHIVGTYDQTASKVYIDGRLTTNVAKTCVLRTNSDNVTIGARSTDNFFNGSLDEVKVYNYARTAEEIRLDYQAGMATHFGPSDKTCSEDPVGCMDKGLVGYWDMEEGNGSMINDKSGNGNNGTLTNGPKWTVGKNGGALNFDGKDDYVNAGSSSIFNLTDSLSLETWVVKNGNGAGSFPLIVGKDYASNVYSYSLRNDGGKPTFASYNNGVLFSIQGNVLENNRLYHLVATFDKNLSAANAKLYVNGVLQNATADYSSSLGTNAAPILIGKYGAGGAISYFNGSIDEVRIYNRALSAEEVRYHYNQGGPAAQWDMDEGTGSVVNDSSGNHNRGTISGATWVEGKHGSALSFDGADDYAVCGSNLTINDSLTVGAWIYPKTLGEGDAGHIVGRGNTGGWLFYVYNGNSLKLYGNGGTIQAVSNANSITLNQWQYVTVVYDKQNVEFFVNGVSAGISPETESLTNVGSCVIGARSAAGDFVFDGYIDDLKVYNYTRTAEQIKMDYQQGVATYLK